MGRASQPQKSIGAPRGAAPINSIYTPHRNEHASIRIYYSIGKCKIQVIFFSSLFSLLSPLLLILKRGPLWWILCRQPPPNSGKSRECLPKVYQAKPASDCPAVIFGFYIVQIRKSVYQMSTTGTFKGETVAFLIKTFAFSNQFDGCKGRYTPLFGNLNKGNSAPAQILKGGISK